jgi:hypothetical protein
VLAEVTRIGQHKGIELASGRKAALYCGDEVLLAYGGRYAPDQFDALVLADPCHLGQHKVPGIRSDVWAGAQHQVAGKFYPADRIRGLCLSQSVGSQRCLHGRESFR